MDLRQSFWQEDLAVDYRQQAKVRMDVITAVVLGGTSMSGGKGKLWGVVLGVLIIGVLTNGLTMINVSSYWQKVIKGIIILAAVIMDNRNAATN